MHKSHPTWQKDTRDTRSLRPASCTVTHLPSSSKLTLIQRATGDRDQIDAVPVTAAIWQIVAEVGARCRDGLAVFEDARVLPHDLLVAEGGPAVHVRFGKKLVHRAADGCAEERLARHRIVVCRGLSAADLLEEFCL